MSLSRSTKRVYLFDLPYALPGLYAGPAIEEIRSLGFWERTPRRLRAKLEGASWWSPVEITKQDLDEIPDDLWRALAARLNLKWRPA